MKKILMAALITITAAFAAFAQAKTYVIDLGSSQSGPSVRIEKNQYGPNYQNTNAPKFTKYFAGDFPEPGDIIEVHYKITPNIDLASLTIAIIDNSPSEKYWGEISKQYETITDLKKDVPSEGVIVFKVVHKPTVEITVQLMYDEPVISTLKLEKTGVKTGRK
ncbi:MAG: hypothetical protein KBT21_04540 [Treponema sp.]|nr:hypothetical protein [Candidatus Treponema merdequi]